MKRKKLDSEMATESRKTYLREREKSLRLRHEILKLRGIVAEKEIIISRLKLQENAHKIELKQNEDKLHATHVEKIKKLQDEILRAKQNENAAHEDANEHQLEHLKLMQQNKELRDQLDHLQQAFTHAPTTSREPSLIPDPNRNVRNHNEYKHPEAPMGSRRFPYDKSSISRPPNEGKVVVARYGSNRFWDLGLCRAHFEHGRTCRFEYCELRHEPLTADEQIYIGRLEPEGSKFIRMVREYNLGRLEKVLL